MGRSGYTEDCDGEYGLLALWRASVNRAIRGRRGQAFLREMLAALDALPHKRLIANHIVRADGECCAIGSVALARKMDVSGLEPSERDEVSEAFDIAPALAAEIAYVNDEEPSFRGVFNETPEQRFERVRAWVAKQIVPEPRA